jgi:hypothetical protein
MGLAREGFGAKSITDFLSKPLLPVWLRPRESRFSRPETL